MIIICIIVVYNVYVFVALDYRIPAFICLGALYIQLAVFFISYKYYRSKM